MQFFIIVLVICFITFLFSLYAFAHDDYVLLRRNVTTDDMFSYAFKLGIISLLFSRIFYILIHPKPVFLNPLGFLLFPYFPGLSLVGGAVGALLFFAYLFRKDKFPKGRVFDFFSMSFLSCAPLGLLGYILLSKDYSIPTILELVLYIVFFMIIVFFMMPRIVKSGKQDGVIGLFFLMFFSAVTASHDFLVRVSGNLIIFEYLILLTIFISSLFLLLKQSFKISIFPKK